jgi:uncharacterized protein (PEP-CTERM system associated)
MDMDTVMGTVTVTGRNLRSKRVVGPFTWRALPFAIALTAIPAAQVLAAEREWRIEPSVTVRAEVHNRTGELEYPSFVSEINPSIVARYRVADTNASFTYSPRLILSDLSDQRSALVQSLLGQASTKFASGRITVGANASIGEQGRDPLSPVQTSALPDNDRIRYIAVGVNGALRENIAPGIFGEVTSSFTYSNARTVGDASELGLRNTDSNRFVIAGEIKPTSRRPEMGWFTGGEYSRRSGSLAADLSSYKGFVGVLWNPTQQLGGQIKAGYEQNEFVTQAAERRGAYGEITADWRPSPRIDVRGDLGKHYYGYSAGLTAKYRGARSAFELSAARQLVNGQESVFFPKTDSPLALLDRYLTGTISDPLARSQEVTRLASVFGIPSDLPESRYFYIDRLIFEQALRASAVYTLPRIAFDGSVSYRKTDPGQSEAPLLSTGAIRPTKDIALNLGAAYRLSNNLTLRFDNSLTRAEVLDTDQSSKRFRSQVAFSQMWTRAISTGVVVFYERQRSDQKRLDYSDRGLSAFLRYSFN